MVRKKNSFFDFKAQGTIEYLIIVAVVIVLSLIVVALVLSSSNNSTAQLIDSSAQMSNVFGGSISASELVIDSNGNALFKLNNLSGDNVTIKKIIVGGEESAYNDLVPSTGERMIFLADSNTNCVCQENQKNAVCVVEIVYVTREGLEKKETRNLTIDCVNTAAPSQPLQVSGLGSGTIDDPFVINSCKELQRMKDNLDWHYALGGDINCAETINWNDGLGFEPIGDNNSYCENESYSGCGVNESTCLNNCISSGSCTPDCGMWWDESSCVDNCSGTYTPGQNTIWHPSTKSFIGSFDGKNHSINNLYINRPSKNYTGLVGYAGSSSIIENLILNGVNVAGAYYVGGLIGNSLATVQNVALENSSISGTNYVGGIIGRYESNTSLSNLYSKLNSISGSTNVGGLIGYVTDGNISESYSTSQVTGSTNVGGLIGTTNGVSSNLKNSYNTGAVSGNMLTSPAGGLIGINYGLILNSYNMGTVTSGRAGGLSGYNYGSIFESYNKGNIVGNENTGGLVGVSNAYGIVVNSFNDGNVTTSKNKTGGIIGYNSSTNSYVLNSFNTGYVVGLNDVGGIIGNNKGQVLNSYNLGDVLGSSSVGGIVGQSETTSSIINSYNIGTISGSGNEIGGVIGYHASSSSSLLNSFNAGIVTSPLNQKGGLVGYNSGEITNGYWDSNLSTQANCYYCVGITNCNTGCTSTNGDGSDYFGSNGIPFSNLLFDGNWVARDNNYPILSWQ
ncbi:MAG: GLUG motif-containing protein [Candidatus Iainarchaeum sp.]|jgi:hypothetical protein